MRHREKSYTYKPSWQAWSRFFPYHPLKKPVLFTPWFETPSLQNCETVNSTNNSVCGGVSWWTSQTNPPLFCCYWSPNPVLLVHLASQSRTTECSRKVVYLLLSVSLMRGKFWRQRKRVVKRGWVMNHQCLLQLVFHILCLAFKYLLKKWIKIEFFILPWLWENINGILFLSLLFVWDFVALSYCWKKKKDAPLLENVSIFVCLFICRIVGPRIQISSHWWHTTFIFSDPVLCSLLFGLDAL